MVLGGGFHKAVRRGPRRVEEIAAGGRRTRFSAENHSARTRGAAADRVGSSREQDRGEVSQRARLGPVTSLHVFSCVFRSRMFSVWWQR